MSARRPTPAKAAVPALVAAVAPANSPVETATASMPEVAVMPAPDAGRPDDGRIEVRQLSIDAGPGGAFEPGAIRRIPADDPMIAGGYVEIVGA